ncbi:hypothetical protein ACFOED_09320 [Vulcaniibacterium thermophilum]|uniref:Uncharacterized protein n=1 Tax=Vulcaniibacterium thermophilum TaxID=1169913 RepID=A0A918Z799_9GAMM|nr:hypothetical protein [Vulcaniibacterium thermophilum]GHE38768.1 hypothetical protein GCM10007167_21070 [Vulcaniibacterium thermophilum]
MQRIEQLEENLAALTCNVGELVRVLGVDEEIRELWWSETARLLARSPDGHRPALARAVVERAHALGLGTPPGDWCPDAPEAGPLARGPAPEPSGV